MATLSTVASHARVSKATASRVLSGRGLELVTPETAERVRRSADTLGYQANPVATALATGKTKVVALWMPNLYRPYYASVMHQLCEVAHAAHYELIIAQNAASGLPQWPVDGIIAHDLSTLPANLPAPLVAIGEWPVEGVDAVRFDLATATRAVIEHLVGQGRTRIGYLRQEQTNRQPNGRFSTYVQTLAEYQRSPIHLPVTEDAAQAGYTALRRFLAAGGELDALFCHNDELALGALHALTELGRSVPRDVAVVGCDDLESSAFLTPALSSIHIPVGEVAQRAWGLLEARLRAPGHPLQRTTLSARFVPRLSSQPSEVNL